MRDKLKVVVAILVVIMVFVLTRACSNYFMGRIREDIKNETKETKEKIITNEYLIMYRNDWEIIVNFFLRGLISYDEMPLSEMFVKKYPVLRSIIQGQCTGESSDSVFDEYDKNNNIMTIRYKTGKGYEQIAYQLHYIINENNELDDIEILDSRVYEDENGSYPKYVVYKTYDENPAAALYCLTNPNRYMDEGDICYLTENYIICHKNYKTESILPWKDWLYIDEGTVIMDKRDNKIWYLEAVNLEEIRKYRIEFKVDERGYIDDYNIEEVEKREVTDRESVKNEYHDFYS